MKGALAWDVEVDSPQRETRGQTRIPDMLLGVVLPLETLQVQGFPVPEFAAIALILLAFNRRPTVQRKIPQPFIALTFAFFALVLLSSYLGAGLNMRRIGHLGVFVLLVVVLATGRACWRSVGVGLAFGLLASGGSWFVGVNPGGYAGRLTGLFGDPNLAGFFLVVLGAVAIAALRSPWLRALIGITLAGFIYLTASRTSLLAAGFLVVWVLLGRWLSPLLGALLLSGLVWLSLQIPEEARTAGQFADRVGSDALRDRIIAAEEAMIAGSPWLGHGAGTAQVTVDQTNFFFHNSYYAMIGEFGWVTMIVFGAIVLAVFGWAVSVSRANRLIWAEAALIGSAVCAIHLGEVLLALPTAVAFGVLLHQRMQLAAPKHRSSDADIAWRV